MPLLHFLFVLLFPQLNAQIKNPDGGLAYVKVVGLKPKLSSVLDPPR